MSEIIPRWEWRNFGSHFEYAEACLKALGTARLQHSDEIYLLSSMCDANVKVRDGLMDIKRCEQTDAHGFELWRPLLKAAFPLPATAIDTVFTALGLLKPTNPLPITLDMLLAELASDSRLRVLEVHKIRSRYQLDGCLAESTEVTTNGETIRTIAVESESPAHINTALLTLGLEGLENVSYPLGLKRLVGMAN